MTDKKKQKKSKADKNEMVRDITQSELIKNPVIYSQLHGDYTIMQQQVMWGLTAQLQDRINTYLELKRDGKEPQSLFVKEDFEEGYITFNIPLSDMNIRADAYDELEKACENLLSTRQVYEDPVSGKLVMNNIFYKIEIPKSDAKDHRRKNYIEIKMIAAQVKDIFSMTHGYTEHMRRIVDRCRRRFTPHLYVYLSKYKDIGRKQIDYIELKDYFGLIEWDNKRKEIVNENYKKYAHFRINVLDPIKAEIDSLWEQGLIDLSFTYEPIYKFGRKRGNPDKIQFNITSLKKAVEVKETPTQEEPKVKEIPTSEEEQNRWNRLASMIMKQDETFWNIFGTPCRSLGIKDEKLTFEMPSTYVVKKWREREQIILPAVYEIWGVKQFTYHVNAQ